MIGKLSGMRLRRCRSRQVHLGIGLLGIASISDRMAFTAAAAETERLGCSRSRLDRGTRHSAVRAAMHSAEVAVAHRGLGACSKSRDMESERFE